MTRLTILLFEDTEKPKQYIDHFFGALKHWNNDGLDETDVVVISQKKKESEARFAAARYDIDATIVQSDNPFVGGHPVWDVLKDMRKAWKYVRGDYVTINHSEFIWCKSRIKRTIEWLKQEKPYLALGNLRRPARDRVPRPAWRPGNCDRRISQPLEDLMSTGSWSRAWRTAEALPTLIWPLWRAQMYQFGPCKWSEDVFFADRRWLESWDAINHGGELPFQDVFDLMGAAIKQMEAVKMNPMIFRMKEDANRIIHMWHRKGYYSWTPEIRDWFMSNKGKWVGTEFLNPNIWPRLFKLNNEKNTNDQYAKYDLRRGPKGTLTRYENAVRHHFQNGGVAGLREFYSKNGFGRRSIEYA